MRKLNLSASMMCADFGSLKTEVKELDEAQIDSYHLDIMDGQFVDNFGLGFQDMEFIKAATTNPLEAHLMVKTPERYFETLQHLELDVVYIHPESTCAPEIALEDLKKRNIISGIAINPGTSVTQIEELLYIADRVLVMCVVPGHAGRTFAPFVTGKIEKLLKLKNERNFEIYWDGACTEEKVLEYAPKGIDGFVLGTSLLFKKGNNYRETLSNLRKKL